MAEYRIDLITSSSHGTTQVRHFIPVAATPDGALVTINEEKARAALKHWREAHPGMVFQVTKSEPVNLDW